MSDLRDRIAKLIDTAEPGQVWVPADFAPLGNRGVIDKTLQRMAAQRDLRRIDRGLYDRPAISKLTKRPTMPDYRAVLNALARRDQSRLLVDGITAANDLGLTDAVPARVTIYTDARRRSIQLGKLIIEFKLAAPSRLYWAGHPAMRVVQALHWLQDMLPADETRITKTLARVLGDSQHGNAIRADLAQGFNVLPAWMQAYLRTVPGFDAALTARSSLSPDRKSRLTTTKSPPRPKRGQAAS